MFGRARPPESFSAAKVQAVEDAARALGIEGPRWARDGATFTHRNEPRHLDLAELEARFERPDRPVPISALALAAGLRITPGPDVIADFQLMKPLLRPRILHERELSGPRRAMCRRDTFGGMLQAVAVGGESAAPLVTSQTLDRWGIDFEPLFDQACANLAAVLGPEHLHSVSAAPGVLSLLHDWETVSGAAFVLDALFPRDFAVSGVVFSVPHQNLLLAMPVSPGAGAEGLAGLVQVIYMAADSPAELLSTSVFWWRDGVATYLPMTAVEDGRSRRIHMEARGPLDELLRILGALD
ncbi:MAG: hypothetical protein SFZ24_09765 [Planctomycetota bacterium]|nr:hypothetical protein [Planctomycetota bacterium]